MLVLLEALVRTVRVEVVSRLSAAKSVEGVAVVLGGLKTSMAMDRVDGFPDPHRVVLGEIVEEPDQLRRPAAGDDGRPWDRTVIPPQLVRGQLRMEGMCDLPGVNLIERGVFRNRPRAGDVERLRPVGVHGIACVPQGRKGRNRLLDRRDSTAGKQFEDEGCGGWARRQAVSARVPQSASKRCRPAARDSPSKQITSTQVVHQTLLVI